MRPWIALAVVLLAPTALAASVSGDLRLPDGATLRGDAGFEASAGALDLSAALPSLRFAAAEGWLVVRTWEFAGTDDVNVFRGSPQPGNETLAFAAGTLDRLVCAENGCRAILLAEGGVVALAGAIDGPLRWRATDDAYFAAINESGADDAFHHATPAGSLVASTAARGEATRLQDATPSARGGLTLFLANASIDVTTDEGRQTVDALPRSEPTTGPLGIATGKRTQARFAVLHLDGAELLAAPGDVTLTAPTASVRIEGALLASRAEGRLLVDGRPRELRGESLRLEGAVALGPAVEGLRVAGAAPLGQALRATLAGDADVRIAGAPVGGARETGAVVVVSIAALVGLLLLAWPLYTRLARASLLENPRRRTIHEHVRAHPGATVAELVRATGISEVVVRHHLRMLEQHQLAVVRGEGKLRAYFALDGSTDAGRMALHVALKDATRRRVAEAVALTPGAVSQKDLVGALGLSQRLVSYHLGKLEEQGLVRGEGAMPRRYVASPALAEFVAPVDAVAA